MKKILVWAIAFIIGALLAVCVLTPAKTKTGDRTDIIQYWTSAEYIKANF